MYNWSARTPSECIEDLIVLCRELKNGLQSRYDKIVNAELAMFFQAFDLEEIVYGLSCFRFDHGKLVISVEDIISWEKKGMAEFSIFFKHVGSLQQIRDHVKQKMASI